MKCPWVNSTLVSSGDTAAVYVVRFLNNPSVDPYALFSGVCTVEVSGVVARIHGMLGHIHRHHLIGLWRWARDRNVKEIHATREPGHNLPRATKGEGDWWVIDLDTFIRPGR